MANLVSRIGSRLLAGFTLRESLIVGLCAVFIVLSALLLHIPGLMPGHKLLGVVFFLLLGRSCVRHPLAATTIGLLAGLIALYPGLGRGSPLHVFQYAGTGAAADLVCFFLPSMPASRPLGLLAGALMGATWFPLSYLFDRLVGMSADMAARHALLRVASVIVWGALAGFLAPTVVRRLRASGLLPTVAPHPAGEQG